MKYKKKPVIVNAIQWLGYNADDVCEFCSLSLCETNIFLDTKKVHIKTLDGEMVASVGDWIVLGIKRELYPVKQDIFEKTYDEVEE